MKLSKRLEAAIERLYEDGMDTRDIADLFRESAALARRVEDAPKFTAERVTAAGMTWVGVDVTGHVEYGQRVRLVPEAGLGGGDGP